MKSYKEVSPEEMQRLVEKAHEEMATQGANPVAGPDKLDPQTIELFKAVDSELDRLKRRIFALEAQLDPFNTMIRSAVDYELSKRGLEITKHNKFAGKACEASPLEQFKYKYNV